MNLTEQFLNEENFFNAFKKVKNYLNKLDEWYNPIELAEYEATLSLRIPFLIKQIQDKTYLPKAVQPFPFPKKDKQNGDHQIRPYFNIHLDDQLIWTAITNVISDKVEGEMPKWSYGNRLYRPIWFEENPVTGKKILVRGSFKNTSQNLYRTWNQSWPLYKRHISLTIKVMSKNKNFVKEDLDDEAEIRIYEQSEQNQFKDIQYIDKNYWNEGKLDTLYWAGLDFKTFFPTIEKNNIIKNIKSCLIRYDGSDRDDVDLILFTINLMLKFPLDTTGWSKGRLSTKNGYNLQNLDIYPGLPTGLIAAGFLANVSLLEIDRAIIKWMDGRRDVAIFKYVDDHVVLAQSRPALLDFLNFYNEQLEKICPNTEFQPSKVEPKESLQYQKSKGFSLKRMKHAVELDVDFPNPLMTNTLKKVSNINNLDFDLLEKEELTNIETDLKHLLLTDFPATEIRKDTKMSFAASKICLLARELKPDFDRLDPFSPLNSDWINNKYKELIKDEISKGNDEISDETRAIKKQEAAEEYIAINLPKAIEKVTKRHESLFLHLLKAIKDNADKIKLWKRGIEFCFLTGFDGLKEIFDLIPQCSLDPQSADYLKSYCLLNIQVLLERAFVELHDETALFWKSYCSWKFIHHVIDFDEPIIRKPKKRYPFVNQTWSNFQEIRIFIASQCANPPTRLNKFEFLLNKRIELSEQEKFRSILGVKNKNERFSVEIIWYILYKINWFDKEEFFIRQVEKIDLSFPLSWSIISIYPDHISPTLFYRIQNEIAKTPKDNLLRFSEMQNFVKENGFTYDLFKKIQTEDSEIFNTYIDLYPKLKYHLLAENKEYLPLNKWLELSLERSAGAKWIDPKLSEWSLIEIVKQIIFIIESNINSKARSPFTYPDYGYYLVHPANYLIPLKWLEAGKVGWDEWKQIVSENRLKLVETQNLIDDFRYFPVSNVWNNTRAILFMGNGELPLVIGYSMLLLKLLSKSFIWPPTANKIEFIDQLYTQAYQILEQEPLSSDMRNLLGAIFSKKSIDIFYSYENIVLDKEKSIKGLKDFQFYLEKIQTRLLNFQLTLKGREPRQLIYINIDDLNQSNNNFFERL
ncbi:hypothetical protein [Pedobacter sp. Leaf132]|uniref:hypothetical protein n=1 Tax=Pedobacter sp. Leaf132 TaxID=2876557 RepID=UPI001E4935C9|nr:hypothetical protein [Pedobacter sp. Leaf132]